MNPQLQSIKQRFGIIGNSPALENALSTAVRVAPTDLTVLITGESGVGKEVFSKIIHELSTRKHNQFIAVNCGAIPEGTINSELFGHEKGAFTGASEARKGYFETVDGGTIFLDEVGDMPLETQTRLLRVLEQGEFIRVGSSKVQKTNVRVVAATNIDMRQKIKQGKFREDLFYRLSTVPIAVPSLKDRKEDIYLLFRKFAVDFSERYRMESIQLDDLAKQILENYTFPGNIRELKNIADQLSILSLTRKLGVDDVLAILPQLGQRYLPTVSDKSKNNDIEFSDRELIYKFLYDMKKDLNDLKSLVVELVRTNNLRMPVSISPNAGFSLPILNTSDEEDLYMQNYSLEANRANNFRAEDKNASVIINSSTAKTTNSTDDTLSLEDMEKDMILKALRKHKTKRRDAALDLGISERTLYRKLKQYNIQD